MKQDNAPEDDKDDTDNSDDSNDSEQDNQDLHQDEEDDEDEEDEETPPRLIVHEYKFGLKEFNFLLDKIPNQIDDYILKLELCQDGYICVRTVPGDPHGTAAGVLVQQMLFWCKDPNNQTVAGMPLKVPMDASMFFSCVC